MRIRGSGIAVVSGNSNRFTYVSLVSKFFMYLHIYIWSLFILWLQEGQMWIKTVTKNKWIRWINIYWLKKNVKINLRENSNIYWKSYF